MIILIDTVLLRKLLLSLFPRNDNVVAAVRDFGLPSISKAAKRIYTTNCWRVTSSLS